MTPRTVAFHTLGCKLNFSETSSLGRLFEDAGYAALAFEESADIYVINTCSVTDFADQKCRQTVRKALRLNPAAFVVVVGCYAQLKPQEIADIQGVDLVLGAAEKFRILDFIDDLSKAQGKGMIQAGAIREATTFTNAFSFGDRTRSFLKIQDGCNYKCTFCTIPQARGASRSDTLPNVIENARKIGALGAKEIVLTGVNLGDFGNGTEVIEGEKPKKEALFIDLAQALDVLSEDKNEVPRFRISSIEPNLLTHEIIDFVAGSQRFMPHFHIPLQSGNNKQLAAMRRRYLRELYSDRVARIKTAMPHACIGVDVIVGFPDETDEDFNETYRFVSDLDVAYLHVFTYSERPNTPAAEMQNAIPMQVRKQRNERLRMLSDMKKRFFYEQHLNTTRPVLWEAQADGTQMHGFTDNYIKVKTAYNESLINTISDFYLEAIDADLEVTGSLVVEQLVGE
jgi:threonylcarbamoyladenosine tRNA methylthiotransferase MtaB